MTDRRSQVSADLEDILQAFVALDSSDFVPKIYCEASDLLKVSPLSLDPISEQVQSTLWSCTIELLKLNPLR